MKLQKATRDDFELIREIYTDIIDKTVDLEKYARWTKGMHPTDDTIMEYIMNGSMYQYRIGESTAGVLAITMEQGADYQEIIWGIEAQDTEVAVIHILGVNPPFQRQGIANQMLEEAIKLAKVHGKKAVRLDSIASNTPAQYMYQRKGFVYRGTRNQYAENTGWTDFYYYEYILYKQSDKREE